MTTQEMIAVMQAAVEGKEIETAKHPCGGKPDWYETAKPVWNWCEQTYRIKPSVPKRVFTLADFPPGTLVRMGSWLETSMELVISWFGNDLLETQHYQITIGGINDGSFKDWSFSTDSGVTWQPLSP